MKTKILFVCMGNICRSPTAEGVFRHLIIEKNLSNSFEIDSAGTHAYHLGNSPDSRSTQTAKKYGVSLTGQQARQINAGDFYYFDKIIAMDHSNLEHLKDICPQELEDKLLLLLNNKSVPDPYYKNNFDTVFELIRNACTTLLYNTTMEKNHE